MGGDGGGWCSVDGAVWVVMGVGGAVWVVMGQWCSVGGDGAVVQCGCDGAGSKDTCHSEYPEVATPPDFVLTQQEWQQHE